MKHFISFLTIILTIQCGQVWGQNLQINDQDYFEKQGLNVMVYHDYYPVGHQSGVTIIQNGIRVAANGDVRLSPLPRPFPGYGERIVDKSKNEIKVNVFYNDTLRNKHTDLRYPYPE